LAAGKEAKLKYEERRAAKVKEAELKEAEPKGKSAETKAAPEKQPPPDEYVFNGKAVTKEQWEKSVEVDEKKLAAKRSQDKAKLASAPKEVQEKIAKKS